MSEQSHPSVVREVDIAEAVAVRTRFGLRSDEDWIREVAANPAAQAGMSEFGIPLTPAEFADLMSRRWDEDLFVQVRGYGLLFPDDFAGAYINLEGSGVVIEFKDHVERHRTALSNLVADPSLVEVRQVEWSLKDLEGFIDQVEQERAWFETIGVKLLSVDHRVNENFVHVDFIGPIKEAADAIEAHFGNPTWLKAKWAGPPRWVASRADLLIEITDTDGRPVPNVRCDVKPEDPTVPNEFGDFLIGSGPNGICEIRNLPAAAYKVSLHELVDNDHHDPEPVREFRVVLPSTGKLVLVVIPAP